MNHNKHVFKRHTGNTIINRALQEKCLITRKLWCYNLGRRQKNFQGGSNGRKDRKIALLSLFQGGRGQWKKTEK